MKNLILFTLTAIFLTSCAKFSDGTSVFSEGLWVIGALLFVGGSAFLWYAHKIHNSGTKVEKSRDEGGGFYFDAKNKTPLTEIWFFWAAVVCYAVFIFFIVYQNTQK